MKHDGKYFFLWLTLIAVVVGIIFSFYHWAIPHLWQVDNYSPLTLTELSPSFAVDETIAYASKVREAVDGNWRLGDIYLPEYKDLPAPFLGEAFPAILIAGLAKLGGGVIPAFKLADFIGPAGIFLGLYYFLNLFTKKRWLAIPGALLTMWFYHYLSYFPYLPSIFRLMVKALETGAYSDFIRSFHPQITFSLWLGVLIGMWQLLNREKYWLLALAIGLSAYSYIFYWTYALAWLGLILVILLLKKQYQLALKIILALTISEIISLPYLINVWQFKQSFFSSDFLIGLTFFSPLEAQGLGLILGMIGLNQFLNKNQQQRFYWQMFYLAGLGLFFLAKPLGFVVNDPISHWLNRVVHPMIFINGISLVLGLVKKDFKKAGIVFTLLLLAYQSRVHWQYFKLNRQAFQIETDKQSVFNWIDQNIEKNKAVATISLLDNLYLSVYTSASSFIPWTQYTIATDAEGINRFLSAYSLVEVPAERIREMFSFTQTNEQLARRKRFNYDSCGGTYFYFLKFAQYLPFNHYNCSIPEEELARILATYQSKIELDFKQYQADYWLWGPQEKIWARANPDELGWQILWQNQSYSIYQLPKAVER